MSKDLYMKDFNDEKIFSLEYDKETLKDMVLDLQNKLQQKENIIKEAREYIKEAIISESTEFYGLIDGEHVLAILDKGE